MMADVGDVGGHGHDATSRVRQAGAGLSGHVSGVAFSVKGMLIECDECTARGPACGDCVVSFLTITSRPHNIEVDEDQAAAITAMSQGGLLPPLRLVRDERVS